MIVNLNPETYKKCKKIYMYMNGFIDMYLVSYLSKIRLTKIKIFLRYNDDWDDNESS